jgi:sortase A
MNGSFIVLAKAGNTKTRRDHVNAQSDHSHSAITKSRRNISARRTSSGRQSTVVTLALFVVGGGILAACGTAGEAQVETTAPTTLATTTTSTSTTTSTTSTTTTLPEETTTTVAAKASGGSSLTRIGAISIPKIGVQQTIYKGVQLRIFDYGVGYWPGTGLPGQGGNMVLGAHRTSGIRPFRNIDQLQVGDTIAVTTESGVHQYRVSSSTIVDPIEGMWILGQSGSSKLTLFACHPPGSVAQRIVVFADYVGIV